MRSVRIINKCAIGCTVGCSARFSSLSPARFQCSVSSKFFETPIAHGQYRCMDTAPGWVVFLGGQPSAWERCQVVKAQGHRTWRGREALNVEGWLDRAGWGGERGRPACYYYCFIPRGFPSGQLGWSKPLKMIEDGTQMRTRAQDTPGEARGTVLQAAASCRPQWPQ